MKAVGEAGYAFALPRLIAQLRGRHARRAEFSRWEAYGLGLLVFGISCVFAANLFLPFVRPLLWRWLALLILPFVIWVAFLVLYYVNALIIAALRRCGLYRQPNNRFQHFVIMSLTTFFAVLFLREENHWLYSLGVFWLTLLGLNLVAIVILNLRHES